MNQALQQQASAPAAAPAPSAPALAPAPVAAPSPAPDLSQPHNMDLKQLDAALTAAEQQAQGNPPTPGAPAAPATPASAAQKAFDAEAFAKQMQENMARMERNLQRELGQARKAQSEAAKKAAEEQAAREKAQREAYLRQNLSPEERVALMDQEAQESARQKSIQELIDQQVEQRLQAYQAEQEGVKTYASGIEQMAGDRYAELEPHIVDILGNVDRALRSQDPEEVERGLQAYDYFAANPTALLWNADSAFRAKGGQPRAAAPAAPGFQVQPGAPAAAPAAAPSPAEQFRLQRQEAGAQASPQARTSAPNGRPATLNELSVDQIRRMDKATLDKLLTEAEGGRR